jgi:hypothetical protein
MSKVHNLFISHSWTYSDAYDKLVTLITNQPYFYFKNYSVPKNDPIHNAPNSKALYEAIKRQMSGCHVVIILAGVYATYSEWINKEVKCAKEGFNSPKPILAIEPWGAEKTSKLVKDNADKIVKWNTESVVAAIRELG